MIRHYQININGNVAIKGNKLFIMMIAKNFGINGNVTEDQNSMSVHAEGSEENLCLFLSAIRRKMRENQAVEILSESLPLEFYEDFIIK